jgi:glycosyltransferase 2 family protein
MRPLTAWLLKATCTALLLTWLLSRPDVRTGLLSLTHLDPAWLLAGFSLAGLAQAFAAWRWHLCLRTTGVPLPLLTVLRLTLISTAAGFLSIGPLGADAVRIALAARRHPRQKTALLGSIGLDHASATPCTILLVPIVLAAAGFRLQAGPWTALLVLLSIAAFLGIGLLLRRFRPLLHDRLLHFLRERATRIGFLKAALLSLPVTLSHYAIFYCAARALGVIVPPFSFTAAAAAADHLASLPITIAGLGVREKTFESLLGHWHHIPPASAIALSLTGLALILLWALAGALCLLAEPRKVIANNQ